MQTSEQDVAWQRLHPTMMLFRLSRSLPNLVIVFWSAINGLRKESLMWLGLAMFFMFLTMLSMLWRYISYRYILDDGHIIIREGILSKKTRRIPVRRIHNINTSQSLLARIFRVMRLDIETAGGGNAEASMEALTFEAVSKIRDYVRQEKNRDSKTDDVGADPSGSEQINAATAAPPTHVIHQARFKELFLAGATTSRLGILAVVFLGVGQYAELTNKNPIPNVSRNVSEYVSSNGDNMWLTGLFIFVILLLTAWLFNIAMAVIRWYGFTLSASATDLNIRSGLFTIREYSMPLDKIQALQCVTSALRRPLRLFELKVRSAGRVGVQEGRQRVESDLLVPITPQHRIGFFASAIWPETEWDAVAWRPVHKFARKRHFRILAVFFTLVWTAFMWWSTRDPFHAPLYWVVAAVVLPVAWGVAHLTYKQTGYACDRDFIYIKAGFIKLHFWVIPTARVQNAVLTQTPFQRRRGLASLTVDLAGSGGVRQPVIPNIELTTAWRLFNRYIHPVPRRESPARTPLYDSASAG